MLNGNVYVVLSNSWTTTFVRELLAPQCGARSSRTKVLTALCFQRSFSYPPMRVQDEGPRFAITLNLHRNWEHHFHAENLSASALADQPVEHEGPIVQPEKSRVRHVVRGVLGCWEGGGERGSGGWQKPGGSWGLAWLRRSLRGIAGCR